MGIQKLLNKNKIEFDRDGIGRAPKIHMGWVNKP